MNIESFLDRIHNNENISFDETMQVIADHYDYTATDFSNGQGEQTLLNSAGTNEGSCKIFAFALLHQLTEVQTLDLFGDYYRKDVLNDPQGSGHQNIRHFMKFGWKGIRFSTPALNPK